MKLYAPKYYREFTCVADKCRHSCCIGWEIDVDDETMQKYTTLAEPHRSLILQSIEPLETPHFRLAAKDRCPHLDGTGLCKIILALGEDHLCEICREHPRFYNDTPHGKEVGLGMACEEACRLILSSDAYAEFYAVETLDADSPDLAFDPLPHRQAIFTVLLDTTLSHSEKLQKIYDTYAISPSVLSDSEWRDRIAALEYLDKSHRARFLSYSSTLQTPMAFEKQLERALAYFVFRHCTNASDEEELCAALGFCLFCERLLASVALAERMNDVTELIDLARTVSEELEYSEDNTEAIKLEFFI